ncbi:M15 family metallopeptidase [Methylosinus sp. LW4]|uniref:M15 family metallopeptidase n=1 Tax=Methylosinus sp. LW4 TaxID=136993 RepID=UPI000378D313|nr:M15 family metallopeptidase [Methylosinus sp. LW4]
MIDMKAPARSAPRAGFVLGEACEAKLIGVHPDLVRVVRAAAARCEQKFVVFEGVRTIARERSLIARGASALKNPFRCRHVPTLDPRHGLVGHAVDLVPLVDGRPQWSWPQIYPIARAMKAAAQAEHVTIEWGGDWRALRDGPHYQLPWALYP